jgi:hypothetical protein
MPSKSVVVIQASGSERFDHQSPGEAVAAAPPTNEDAKQSYFCRGCGLRLQPGFRGHFHKECLRTDKRRRVQWQRRQEHQRFESWLHRQHCPKCGARYDAMGSECVTKASCEASRPIQGGD